MVALLREAIIIEWMDRSGTQLPLLPLDWISLILRALALVAMPHTAFLFGRLNETLIYIISGWLVFTLLVSIARMRWWESPAWDWIATAVDIIFATAVIFYSGLLSSPLWWSLLIGPLWVGLIYGLRRMLSAIGVGLVILAVVGVVLSGAGFSSLIATGIYAVALVLMGAILGLVADQVRGRSIVIEKERRMIIRTEEERQRARTIFRMAAELNASLDFDQVLDQALDLSSQALAQSDVGEATLVSALLLFSEDQLHVASARRLDHADWRVTLPGMEGVIQEALASEKSVLSDDPALDPELRLLAALQSCHSALCIPLASTLQVYGILLFAHPNPTYFSDQRIELLEAFAHQVTIALQNAQLYRDVEREKERITEIQDETRKMLARDLHDGPTQTIAGIAMTINFARRLMHRDPQSADHELRKVEEIARNTTREIRHMLFTLRPLILESWGLEAALYQLADKVHDTHRQKVIVEAEPDVAQDLDIGRQGAVFYIAEEAINNARKHAEAEHVWVRLHRRGDQFMLEIEDDGVGFNVGAVDANYAQRGSLGIVNMRERTELVDGEMHIKSAEGEGTCITIIMPLMGDGVEKMVEPESAN
jgi:signal transduction histidine kinase